MNAEIFCHYDQEARVQSIESRLPKLVYSGIKVTRLEAAKRPGLWDKTGAYSKAARYVQLLLAAIPPDRGLAMGVQDLYYGFYMYSQYFGQYRNFQEEGARELFPAVAVNDRMVLVPHQLGKRLTGSDGISLFRPLEMGGLLEVDFDQPESIDRALLKIGDMLRTEAVQMVRQYSSYHPNIDINVSEMARELGFETPFLEEALKRQARQSVFYGDLTCEFTETHFPMNRWTRVGVKISNSSDVGLHGLSVGIKGPVRILPEGIETNVPAKSSVQIDVSMRPNEEGEFPVEVVFSLAEDRALKSWLPAIHVWLTTGDTSS